MSKTIFIAMVLVASAFLVASPIAIGGLLASGHSAERSFSSEWVAPGGEITVTITARDYGPFAQVVETLPEGFGFVGTSLSDAAFGSRAAPSNSHCSETSSSPLPLRRQPGRASTTSLAFY